MIGCTGSETAAVGSFFTSLKRWMKRICSARCTGRDMSYQRLELNPTRSSCQRGIIGWSGSLSMEKSTRAVCERTAGVPPPNPPGPPAAAGAREMPDCVTSTFTFSGKDQVRSTQLLLRTIPSTGASSGMLERKSSLTSTTAALSAPNASTG